MFSRISKRELRFLNGGVMLKASTEYRDQHSYKPANTAQEYLRDNRKLSYAMNVFFQLFLKIEIALFEFAFLRSQRLNTFVYIFCGRFLR